LEELRKKESVIELYCVESLVESYQARRGGAASRQASAGSRGWHDIGMRVMDGEVRSEGDGTWTKESADLLHSSQGTNEPKKNRNKEDCLASKSRWLAVRVRIPILLVPSRQRRESPKRAELKSRMKGPDIDIEMGYMAVER
jgi:hypothetical protein